MNVKDLLKKYNMEPHAENGSFAECHYPHEGEGRAASGSSYFYVAPGEYTLFHRIDCDEYWCYNGGSDLEAWIIGIDGKLEIKWLGTGDDAELRLYLPKGAVFASRNRETEGEGTFFSCITVPRFSYEGFELLAKEDVIKLCPEAAAFWE